MSNDLFQTRVEFSTSKLLEQMVRLSEWRMKDENMQKHFHPGEFRSELGTVGFSFGRRAGHTTAIADWIKAHTSREERPLVILHNSNMEKIFTREYIDNNKANVYPCLTQTLDRFVEKVPLGSGPYGRFHDSQLPTRIFFDGPAWTQLFLKGHRYPSPGIVLDQPGLCNVKSIVWCGS